VAKSDIKKIVFCRLLVHYSLMTFEDLAVLLSSWYNVDTTKIGIEVDDIPVDIHPVLIDFYRAIGQLAERDTPFKIKGGYEGPLSGQDFICPIGEVKHKNGYTIFGSECQENYHVSASRNFHDMNAYADGEWDPDSSADDFQNTKVPLRECLITFALKETIASAVLFDSEKIEDELLREAIGGLKHSGRYVWDSFTYEFHLSKNLWCMKLSDSDRYYFARKNDWQKTPSERTIR
jgi:hypothetical protein